MKMEIVVRTDSFVKAVGWVTKNYNAKSTSAYVGLTVDTQGNAHLNHTADTSFMKAPVEVLSSSLASTPSAKNVHLALDGAYVKQLVGALTGDTITLSRDFDAMKTSVDVVSKNGKFTIPVLDVPIKREPKVVEIGDLDYSEFFDSLSRLARLCDAQNSGSSSFVGAVDFGFDQAKETLTLFATDKFALSTIEIPFSPAVTEDADDAEVVAKFTDTHVLLPYVSASTTPGGAKIDMRVTLIGSSNHGSVRMGYRLPDGSLALFSLLNADPCGTVDMMKRRTLADADKHVTVGTKELLNAIKVVSSLSMGQDDVYIKVTADGEVIVSDVNKANTVAVDSTSVELGGEEARELHFLKYVITTAFSPVSTSQVSVKWGKSATAVLEPVLETGDPVDGVFIMSVMAK